MRPFYFYVTFWGERHRCFFANILLRSLLAPANLPLLDRADGHKILVCCPEGDWTALQSHPAAQAAARYIELVHVPTPPPPPGRHPVEHMEVGHMSAAALCFEAKAYGSLLHPDMVFADGFVASLLRHRDRGTQAVLAPALRLKDDPLFRLLGLDATRDDGSPLVVEPRQIVAASVKSLHDEIVECELDGPRFSILPNSVWWRNGAAGIQLHSFTWSPLLIDYAALPRHEVDGLCGPLPDGDYVARNFPPGSRIHYVQDSDEIVFASWTPAAVGAREDGASLMQRLPGVGRVLRHALLRRAYLHYTRDFYPRGDHVKATGFAIPLRFRTKGDAEWAAVSEVSQREIAKVLGDVLSPPTAVPTAYTRMLDRVIPLLGPYETSQRAIKSGSLVVRRLAAAVRGDRQAREWISGRLRARLGG